MRSHALVAAFGDDVGGAELQRELLARSVTAHRDDPFGAELLGGQHAEQADRAVAHHGHRLAGADLGGDGAEPAGAEDVGGGQQARDQIGVGGTPGVATRVPSASGTRIRSAWAPPRCRGSRGDARRLVAGLADLAGVVGGEERPDHELARRDRGDLGADLLPMPTYSCPIGRRPTELDAAVGPQVGPADAGRRQAG